MLFLAEVSDKTLLFSEAITVSGVIAIIALAISRFRWWLVLTPLPLICFWSWIVYDEQLHEANYATAVIRELGINHYANLLIAINWPYLLALGIVFLIRSRAYLSIRSVQATIP